MSCSYIFSYPVHSNVRPRLIGFPDCHGKLRGMRVGLGRRLANGPVRGAVKKKSCLKTRESSLCYEGCIFLLEVLTIYRVQLAGEFKSSKTRTTQSLRKHG